jgi:hypothetical protein
LVPVRGIHRPWPFANRQLSDLIIGTAAYETSLKNAVFVFKYGFGFFLVLFGLAVFNKQHPYGTEFICLGFIIVGTFFLSVARVMPEREVLKYRNWFCWHTVSYSEIQDCGESWILGYIKCRHYLLPWGKIYSVRGYADDPFFGLDKKIISSICNKAGISYPAQAK